MKMIITILFVLATTYCSHSFAQSSDTVHYTVLRNKPNDLNNLYLYAMPLNIDILNSYMNISYGFGTEYNYRDKFILGFDFRRSYTEKVNDLIMGPDELIPQKIGSPKEGKKNFTTFEFTAQFLLGGRLRVHNEKTLIQDDLYGGTYIKVKAMHFIALALRASYGYHHYPLYSSFSGYKINDPSTIIEGIGGVTMHNMQFASFGLGIFQKQDLKIKTDDFGTKDYSMTTLYYLDVLLPISQNLTNMEVEDCTSGAPIYYEVNVEYPTMSSYGLRVGVRYQIVSRAQKINPGTKFEIGFLPGLNKLPTNFYISLGLEINISYNTRK